ncbi:MAG: porin family protein [Candidatus Azobacteroides sp.]|nr:porin family protein [Candidatus Azobacteroides sp.]
MKKLVLLSCLVIAGLVTANAQGLKGKWYGTAQVGYSDTKAGNEKTSYFNVLPIVGTFISPDVTVGLAFGYLDNKSKGYDLATTGVLDSEVRAWAFEPLARRYWNISGPFFFFGQLAVPLAFGKVQDTNIKVSQFGIGASAGFDMVIWKSVSIEFSYNIANLSFTRCKGSDLTTLGLAEKISTTNFQLAHVANLQNGGNIPAVIPLGEQSGLLTPISVGIKFFFN